MIEVQSSIRADLLGGTLDLAPIHLILRDVVTLNCALELKARVSLRLGDKDGVEIVSKDYGQKVFFPARDFTPENLRNGHFGAMTFVACLLDFFGVRTGDIEGLTMELESGSPPGAGLGGSSSMGIALFRALCQWSERPFKRDEAAGLVQTVEAQILKAGPAGYQDYYPALYGGILGLIPSYGGVRVEQYFTSTLKAFLEERLTLVYSGETRASGINNWEVYKNFFEGIGFIRRDLQEVADLASRARKALLSEDFELLLQLIAEEGNKRKQLFPGMVTDEMEKLYQHLVPSFPGLGMKVCGAGGGGAFLLIHGRGERAKLTPEIEAVGMRLLDFRIAAPVLE